MAAKKKNTLPEPIALTTICSVCGLSWSDHGETPTTDDCIRLLKAALAKKPTTIPQPYPVPTPYRPYVRPWYWEEWYNKGYKPYGPIYYSKSDGSETYGGYALTERTPKVLSISCKAV